MSGMLRSTLGSGVGLESEVGALEDVQIASMVFSAFSALFLSIFQSCLCHLSSLYLTSEEALQGFDVCLDEPYFFLPYHSGGLFEKPIALLGTRCWSGDGTGTLGGRRCKLRILGRWESARTNGSTHLEGCRGVGGVLVRRNRRIPWYGHRATK